MGSPNIRTPPPPPPVPDLELEEARRQEVEKRRVSSSTAAGRGGFVLGGATGNLLEQSRQGGLISRPTETLLGRGGRSSTTGGA